MKGTITCLICGRCRIETVCGDQSCPCTGGAPFSSMRAIFIVGLGFSDGTMTMPCGRAVRNSPAAEETLNRLVLNYLTDQTRIGAKERHEG